MPGRMTTLPATARPLGEGWAITTVAALGAFIGRLTRLPEVDVAGPRLIGRLQAVATWPLMEPGRPMVVAIVRKGQVEVETVRLDARDVVLVRTE